MGTSLPFKHAFRLLRRSRLSLLFLILLLPGVSAADSNPPYQRAMDLFQAGKPKEAQLIFEQILASAEKPIDKWWALMSLGWFYDETGAHRKSLDFSNRALEIAVQLDKTDSKLSAEDRAFYVGRSLNWIAWAYKAMGHYDAAIKFYQEAIERGAPRGEILSLYVWGLATQELGSIYYLRGDVEEGRKLIEAALDKAISNNVLTGIAECGTLLAEIALDQSNTEKAKGFAERAYRAAEEDNGSVYNAARARLVRAKVSAKLIDGSPERNEQFKKLVDDSLSFATKRQITRVEAESLLLQARAYPGLSSDDRINTLSKALGILSESESELAGTAEGRLGEEFLAKEANELAARYLKHGFRVNEKMLRAVDNAFLQPSLAELAAREGKSMEELQLLTEALERSKTANLKMAVVENGLKLAEKYAALGYQSLAQSHADNGLRVAEELKLTGLTDKDKIELAAKEAKLYELAISAKLKTEPPLAKAFELPQAHN